MRKWQRRGTWGEWGWAAFQLCVLWPLRESLEMAGVGWAGMEGRVSLCLPLGAQQVAAKMLQSVSRGFPYSLLSFLPLIACGGDGEIFVLQSWLAARSVKCLQNNNMKRGWMVC